jgi:hypothetical protein
MKIKSGDFRIRTGESVKLNDWPTIVKPNYNSKEEYEKILAEHISEGFSTLLI